VKKENPNSARQEKRQDERFSAHLSVIFSLFGTKSHREYASMTFNHSRNGMCIEAGEAIRPGTTIYIRRENKPVDVNYEANWKHLRNFSLAEVRWCRELTDKFGSYYRVGVKYL
jgi:hypothetical protein